MKEPERIPLTNNPRIKQPKQIPLKPLDENWECINTADCSGIILVKKNEDNKQDNPTSIQQLESDQTN